MRRKAEPQKASAEKVVKDIRRATRKHYGAEEKIRIVLEGLRGEESRIARCPLSGDLRRSLNDRLGGAKRTSAGLYTVAHR